MTPLGRKLREEISPEAREAAEKSARVMDRIISRALRQSVDAHERQERRGRVLEKWERQW